MADNLDMMLNAVRQILKDHPELAPRIERMAGAAQGKSAAEMVGFNEWKLYRNLDVGEVFTKIYLEGHWGKSLDPEDRFFSGSGSRDPAVVGPYVDAVRGFLAGFADKPSVVDLGCGDFNVGARLRDLCGSYVACDIVEALIAHNRERFADLDVDFRQLDIIEDMIPQTDIVIIRQVLQHLSNGQIARALRNITASCRYLVVTEHLPGKPDFRPNVDKPAGGAIRPFFGSGIVLTSEPFALKVLGERILCEVPELGGVIRTTLYTLR